MCFFNIQRIILTLHLDKTICIIYACCLLLLCKHTCTHMFSAWLVLRSTWVFALELLSALKEAYLEAHFSACALFCTASVLLPKVLRIWIELFVGFTQCMLIAGGARDSALRVQGTHLNNFYALNNLLCYIFESDLLIFFCINLKSVIAKINI